MRDELAAYHELVAAAHRHHGKVEADLPVLELPGPSDDHDVIEVSGSSSADDTGAETR